MSARRTAGDVMSRPVITASPETGFRRLVELMRERMVSALPVVDDAGRPLGVVSEDDLLAGERTNAALVGAAWAERWRLGPDRRRSHARRAGELMTRPALTVTAGTPLALAARRMHDERVRRLLVVDGDGLLVGIVSRRDLLSPYLASDPEIRADVLEAIRTTPAWSEISPVDIAVDAGVVRITGEVERRSDALAIAALARCVDGVVDVDDQLGCRVENIRDAGYE